MKSKTKISKTTKELGLSLKKLRRLQGKTLNDFKYINGGYVSHIECGRVDIKAETLNKYFKDLNLSKKASNSQFDQITKAIREKLPNYSDAGIACSKEDMTLVRALHQGSFAEGLKLLTREIHNDILLEHVFKSKPSFINSML